MTVFTKLGVLLGVAAMAASADTIVLKNGETVQGTFLGGTARQIRVDLNGDIRTFDVDRVQSINFEPGYSTAPPPSRGFDQPPAPPPPPPNRGFNQPPPPSAYGIQIPSGSEVTVRMIDSVDSERAVLGQTFRASLDEPIVVDGREVVPRGADVLTKLIADEKSGKIQGRTVLTMAISTITIDGRPVDVTSNDVQTASGSRGKRSAGVIGGGAALGAVIGAIAGGGKGAAIGAGSGAAIGTAGQVLTGGQKVRIPSETRLTFTLQQPVQL